jgi:hypothetical protein
MSTEEVRGIFRHALDNLRTCGDSVPLLRGAEFDFLRQDVVRNTVLDPSLPRAGRIYDHLVRNTPPVFQFTDAVLSAFDRYWHENQTSPADRMRLALFFFVHEYFHIHQKVDSETFNYSRQTPILFQNFDYIADAISIQALVMLDIHKAIGNKGQWRQSLIDYLRIAIDGSTVFSFLEDSNTPDQGLESMDAARFYRNLIWLFQYARAVSFDTRGQFDDFNIHQPVSIEVVLQPHIRPVGIPIVGVVQRSDLQVPLRLVIGRGARYIYEVVDPGMAEHLIRMVMNNSLDDAEMFFRPFWSSVGESLVQVALNASKTPATSPSHLPSLQGIFSPVDWQNMREAFFRIQCNGPMRKSLVIRIAPTGKAGLDPWASLLSNHGNDTFWDELQGILEPSENIDIIKKLLNHLQEIAMNQRDKNLYKELGQRI